MGVTVNKDQDSRRSVKETFQIFFSNRITVYIIRRFITMIPLFFGISILTFGMVRLLGSPTDLIIIRGPARQLIVDNLNLKYGLDKPLPVQYLTWLKNFFLWDFGYSGTFATFTPARQINTLIWHTFKLQYAALFFSVIISIPLGIAAARYHQTSKDTGISTVALLGVSMPVFVLGISLIILTRRIDALNWVPIVGAQTPNREEVRWIVAFKNWDLYKELFWFNIKDTLLHLILPVITLTIIQLALTTRLVRSNMLEILRQDFILAARANGLSERVVIFKHALRNAIIPVITFIGIAVGTALAGAPITETVFTYPGLGFYYIFAIFALDMSIVLAITMIITVMILIFNLVADILYVIVDPRIKL